MQIRQHNAHWNRGNPVGRIVTQQFVVDIAAMHNGSQAGVHHALIQRELIVDIIIPNAQPEAFGYLPP